MSWLRYSDDFTTDRVWDLLSYEARWHYLALNEQCSQSRRWDGVLPVTRAVRVSDVPDPEKCLAELTRVGLARVEADTVTLPFIAEHVPPPGERDENLLPRKRRNQAAYRRRQCERGEHSRWCPRDTCAVKQTRETARETGNPGTGRDGTGNHPQEQAPKGSEYDWPPVAAIPEGGQP